MCTMEIKQSVFERRMAVYTAEMWQKSWMNEFKWALDAQAASRGGLRTSLSNTARRRHGNVCRCTITMLCLTKRSSARATVASNLPSARRHIAARSRRAAPPPPPLQTTQHRRRSYLCSFFPLFVFATSRSAVTVATCGSELTMLTMKTSSRCCSVASELSSIHWEL